jgi:hypothetical protein
LLLLIRPTAAVFCCFTGSNEQVVGYGRYRRGELSQAERNARLFTLWLANSNERSANPKFRFRISQALNAGLRLNSLKDQLTRVDQF